MKRNKKDLLKKIFGWISFGIGIFLSVVIIANSCLHGGISGLISGFLFVKASDTLNPNSSAPTVSVNGANLSFYSGFGWNDVEGYEQNQIPLGCTKALEFIVTPSNATNTNYTYSCTKDDVVLTRSGKILYVQPNSLGEFTIEFTSSDGGFKKSQTLNAVDLIAPQNFNVEDQNIELVEGKSVQFNVSYLDERMQEALMNVRYYDQSKLTFTSNDTSVVTVNEYGVITSKSVGSTTVTVSNGALTKTLNVEVTPNPDAIVDQNTFTLSKDKEYTGIQDMDYDRSPQEGEVFHTHLSVNWDNMPTDDSVTFVSNNPLVAMVDQQGNVRGYRKNGTAEITCFANRNPNIRQTITIETRDVQVTDFNISADGLSDLTIGKNRYITPTFSPRNATDQTFECESLNVNIATAVGAGRSINVSGVSSGEVTIKVWPSSNPELKKEFKIKIVHYSVTEDPEYDVKHAEFRKLFGHLSLFAVTALFLTLGIVLLWSYLTPIKYILYLISMTYGVAIAALSELIQHFVPERAGSFEDVMIDSAGYAIGVFVILTVFVIIDLVKLIKARNKK